VFFTFSVSPRVVPKLCFCDTLRLLLAMSKQTRCLPFWNIGHWPALSCHLDTFWPPKWPEIPKKFITCSIKFIHFLLLFLSSLSAERRKGGSPQPYSTSSTRWKSGESSDNRFNHVGGCRWHFFREREQNDIRWHIDIPYLSIIPIYTYYTVNWLQLNTYDILQSMVQKMYLLNGVARIQHSQLPLCQDELCTCWTLVYTSVICRYFQHMVAICGNMGRQTFGYHHCTTVPPTRTYQDLPSRERSWKELKGAGFLCRSSSAIPSCCV